MGFIANIFNTAVDIITVPAKVGTRLIDNTFDFDTEDIVDEIRESAKIEDD